MKRPTLRLNRILSSGTALGLVLAFAACGADPAATSADAFSTDAGKDDGTTADVAVAHDTGADTGADLAATDSAQPADIAVVPTIAISFTATIPIETPRAATVKVDVAGLASPVALDCGLATTTCSGTVELQENHEASWRLVLDTEAGLLVPLSLEGAPEDRHTLQVGRGQGSAPVTTDVVRWGPETGASAFALAFVVKGPPNTPIDESIHISGSAPSLGDWDGRGVTLVEARLGMHATTVDIDGVRSVAFKATRGSWYTVEKGSNDEEIADRRADVGGGLRRVEVNVARWADLVPRGTGTYTGDVRILRGVASEALNNQRDVIVWLPAGYRDNPNARYPVVYLHDGQNTMDAGSAFSGVEWQVDEALGATIASGAIEPVIAVAVANTSDRIWEYTPTVDAEYGGGGASLYGHFLVDVIKPLVDAHYRTDLRASATGFIGSSLGGLVTLWLGLEYPDVFGRLGVVSPSVWWDDRTILNTVSDYDGPQTQRIWLDIGTAEGDGASPVTDARALRDTLVGKGWGLGTRLTYREYDGAGHNERAWAARFGDIITNLYAR